MTFAYSHHGPRYNAARFFIYGLSLALRWIAASSSFAQPKASRRRSLASVVPMLASPDACSGAAHSACQPPSRQGEASQSANDALHAASIDGPPGTPSDEDKRKPSTIVQAEWRIAYSGWRMADGEWRMRQRITAAFPRPSAALPVISHDARRPPSTPAR